MLFIFDSFQNLRRCPVKQICNLLTPQHSTLLDKALNKLQLVLNTAARILTRTPKIDHITPVLASLHWLPVKADFKVLLLTYKALHGLAPTYLSDLVLSYILYLHVRYGHKTQAS